MNTPSPFDALAPTYDEDFSASPIAAYLREQVHKHLLAAFPPGSHVLELGCGTGDDALRLAERGIRVTATDSSTAMLAATGSKIADQPLIRAAPLDLNRLADDNLSETFDGAFSNFGPINCVADRVRLARWLAQRIRPGGCVLLVVMAPCCLWEIGWHILHADFPTAFRRLAGAAQFQLNDCDAPITVFYPSPARLEREFFPYFLLKGSQPLGLFLPPSGLYPAVERRPLLLRLLKRLDAQTARFAHFSIFADHYILLLQRNTMLS
ncbi:MAG: class I SAM-dependent methyltransferase [Aggregatilineales bacterium]